MSTEVAPIGISVYTRIDHFRRCIEALKNNTLARESELFIYSDAPSNVNDACLVGEVRKYAHSIRGFKSVRVIERVCACESACVVSMSGQDATGGELARDSLCAEEWAV